MTLTISHRSRTHEITPAMLEHSHRYLSSNMQAEFQIMINFQIIIIINTIGLVSVSQLSVIFLSHDQKSCRNGIRGRIQKTMRNLDVQAISRIVAETGLVSRHTIFSILYLHPLIQ